MKYKFVMDTTKPVPLCGTKTENRDGAMITAYKDFVFRGGDVVDCEDFNMISWVDSGLIMEVECDVVPSVVDTVTDDGRNSISDTDTTDTQTSSGDLIFTNGGLVINPTVDQSIDVEDKEDSKEVTENDSNNDTNVSTNGYYPTDDGQFRCAYCGKLFKTEKSAILHVDRYHKE